MVPRAKGNQTTPAAAEQRQLMWGMTGAGQLPQLTDWDPKTEPLVAALLEVLGTGATVVLRPGSGGRSIGVAIWEGDHRHQPQWCYEAEELDNWAHGINMVAEARRGLAAD